MEYEIWAGFEPVGSNENFGLENITPDIFVCELQFPKNVDLCYMTNLLLIPKPQGVLTKFNPVPNSYLIEALKDKNNPFKEKILSYIQSLDEIFCSQEIQTSKSQNKSPLKEQSTRLKFKSDLTLEISGKSELDNFEVDQHKKLGQNLYDDITLTL